MDTEAVHSTAVSHAYAAGVAHRPALDGCEATLLDVELLDLAELTRVHDDPWAAAQLMWRR